jgi:hypothetical protein
MIYNPLQQRVCIGEILTKDLLKTLPPVDLWNVKGWYERQQNRLDIRLYAFVKDVLSNGFVNPVIIWYSDTAKEFSIHPGMNRLMLNRVLNLDMKAWVISYDVNNYRRLGKLFPGITKLRTDINGNRDIKLTAQHRTDNRLYEIVFDKDRILPQLRTESNSAKWNEVSSKTGFHIWHNNEYIGAVGNAQDHWNVKDVSGVYELALKYYFNRKTNNAFIHRKST